MRDRFLRGILAGLAGALGKDVVDVSSRYVFHFSKSTFWEWNAILILGRPPGRILDWLLAQAGELTLSSFLGLVFVYLTSHLWSSRFLVLKAALYGIIAGYFLYAVPLLFRVPGLVRVATETAVTHFASTLVFGLCMGWALLYMNRES